MRRLVVSLALIVIAGAVRAESFFGIELGAPFAVRDCTPADVGIDAISHPLEVCTARAEDTHHPWGAITHTVNLVGGNFNHHGLQVIYVKEFNGVVVNIGAVTRGELSQELVLHELTEKFGPPHSSKKSLVQNGFGAQFAAIHATWTKPACMVRFDGMTDSREVGEIDISTKAAASEERAANAWRATRDQADARM